MKILEINAVSIGSTGKIMLMVAAEAIRRGYEVITAVAKSRTNGSYMADNHVLIGDRITRNISAQLSYFTGYTGCFSYIATILFLKKVRQFNPDIIHIHNLHSDYINIPMLFRFIKKHRIPVVWTLHDCWPFTGCCAHFIYSKCDKWKNVCEKCNQYRTYPGSYWDNANKMYKLKKEWFTSVDNLTIVVPSQWLGSCVKESFLGQYPIRVIYNGVDTEKFQYVNNTIRQKYNITQNQIVLLGVASSWSDKKGLNDYYKMIELLPENYVVVLVGIKKTEIPYQSSRIICIERVADTNELASFYSAADILLSLSYGETFGMTIAEANACGTPAIVYDNTAQPELVSSETGMVVSTGNINELVQRIIDFSEKLMDDEYRKAVQTACVNRTKEKFCFTSIYSEYVDLFESIC